MITKTDKHLNSIFGTSDADMETAYEPTPLTPMVKDTPPVEYRPTPVGEVISDEELMDAEDAEFKADISKDYDESRENIRGLIYKSEELLDMAISIAQSTEDPKAIESASSILMQLASLNEKLLKATETRQKVYNQTRKRRQNKLAALGGINSNNTQDNSTTNVEKQTNIVFQGSSADLAKMIREMQNEDFQ